MLNQKLVTTKKPHTRSKGSVMLRGFRNQRDFAIMAKLINLAFAADGVPEGSTAAELAQTYCPRARSLPRGADRRGQRPAGVLQPGKNGAVRGVYQSSTFTHPEWRAELGEAVLAFDEGRIRQPASEHEAKWLDNGIN